MKKNSFKALALSLVAMFSVSTASAQVEVAITGLPDAITDVVNNKMGFILSECNFAQESGIQPDLTGLTLLETIREQVTKTFQDCPFRCPEDVVVQPVRKVKEGYEVRNVPIIMCPTDKTTGTWKTYQDLVFTIDFTGELINFRFSVNADEYAKAMGMANSVTELDQLQMIMEYLERFRNAYCLKDIDFLDQVFSDDALIITGTVLSGNNLKKETSKLPVKYTKYSKKEYIGHLRDVFRRNAKISVTFEDISIKRHPSIDGLYGVQLKQGYQSDRYGDVGYLFLLWDFRNPERPQIHIRTWQDERLWTEATASEPQEERYDIDSFDLSDF